jgi:RNA polymerase sigma-70 factor (sigma-E family)
LEACGDEPRVSTDPSFTELYEREFPAVFRAAYLMSGDRGLAEEATQEAFARALARWGRLRSQPWAGGWVTTTALNTARRHLRRRRPTMPTNTKTSPDEDDTTRLDVHAAVRRLPARQQEAVVLYYLLDMPVADTAAAMGCDQGTVKTHLSRAREALLRALSIDDEPSPHTRSRDHG